MYKESNSHLNFFSNKIQTFDVSFSSIFILSAQTCFLIHYEIRETVIFTLRPTELVPTHLIFSLVASMNFCLFVLFEYWVHFFTP